MRRLLCSCCLSLLVVGCGPTDISQQDKSVLDAFSFYYTHELDQNGRIIALVLEGPQVDDRALVNIPQLTQLRRLSLYGAAVTDKGIAKLTGLPRLEALGLGNTQVTDRGLARLERMPGLCHLWLSKDGKVTNAGIGKLRRALPGLVVYRQ